jgi:hypothetical protein
MLNTINFSSCSSMWLNLTEGASGRGFPIWHFECVCKNGKASNSSALMPVLCTVKQWKPGCLWLLVEPHRWLDKFVSAGLCVQNLCCGVLANTLCAERVPWCAGEHVMCENLCRGVLANTLCMQNLCRGVLANTTPRRYVLPLRE